MLTDAGGANFLFPPGKSAYTQDIELWMSGRAVRVVLAFLKGSFLAMGYMGVDKHDGFDGWGRYVEPKCPCQGWS